MIMDLPYISILTPTYNRNHFIPLMLSNLVKFDYPKDKLEWVIDDDGTEKMINTDEEMDRLKQVVHPIKIKYLVHPQRRLIGVKRNYMVKQATHKIVAMMDTDDLYMSPYLKKSIELMNKEKCSLVGSNQMVFMYPHHNCKITAIECSAKRQIHEATMVFTKKHWKAMGGFAKNSQGEGAQMIDSMKGTKIGLTHITDCMLCIAHKQNTIDKGNFLDAQDISKDCRISPLDIQLITDICLRDELQETAPKPPEV
jgi:glycosyltransferase involved in cell wall biosynthesis